MLNQLYLHDVYLDVQILALRRPIGFSSSAFPQHIVCCQTVRAAVFTSAMKQEEAGTTACAEISAEAVVTVLPTPCHRHIVKIQTVPVGEMFVGKTTCSHQCSNL